MTVLDQSTDPLLDVAHLRARFDTDRGAVQAVNDVSFTISAHETLAVVGESGSGKSVTALSIMGLLSQSNAHVSADRMRFDGHDLMTLDPAAMRDLRGRDMAMIFQDPMASLNPVMTVGRQLSEIAERHLGMTGRAARTYAAELLDLVDIPSPAARLGNYPHQFSGGMRQRVMIAMAIACKPKLLIADEPTTALDVTIQAQILDLLTRLQGEFGMAIMIVTHDLGVVARIAEKVMVMYAGRIVEPGTTEAVFSAPQMPYMQGLLRSIPRIDGADDAPLVPIRGTPPHVTKTPQHCSFAARCDYAHQACLEQVPPLRNCGDDHHAACLLAGSFDPAGS